MLCEWVRELLDAWTSKQWETLILLPWRRCSMLQLWDFWCSISVFEPLRLSEWKVWCSLMSSFIIDPWGGWLCIEKTDVSCCVGHDAPVHLLYDWELCTVLPCPWGAPTCWTGMWFMKETGFQEEPPWGSLVGCQWKIGLTIKTSMNLEWSGEKNREILNLLSNGV